MSAASEMSMMQSSIAEAPGARAKEDDQDNKVFLVLLVLALLLLLAIIGVKSTMGASNEEFDDGDDSEKKGSNPPSGGPDYKDRPTAPPTTSKRTRKTTTTVPTPSPSADKFVEPRMTPPLPKPQPGDQNETLLCVVGERSTMLVFPEDGLCSLTFFADLVYVNGTFRGKGHPVTKRLSQSWTVFQQVAEQSKKTAYGISADFSSITKFSEAFIGLGPGKLMLKEFFDKKIVHHGILNAEGSENSLAHDAGDSKKLGLIKTFRQLHNEWGATNSHLIIGLRFTSYKDASRNTAKAAAIKTIISKLSPTIVVVHTHINSWKPGDKPMCMTPWDYPISREHQPSMKDAVTQVIPNATVPDNTIVLTSFTMGSMIFRTSKPYHSSQKSFNATAFGFVKYAQACKGVLKYKDFDAKAEVFIWSHDTAFSVCAETSETMISKVKKWFKMQLPKYHGVALFDVELDDFDNACKNGSFSRIKALKDYLWA